MNSLEINNLLKFYNFKKPFIDKGIAKNYDIIYELLFINIRQTHNLNKDKVFIYVNSKYNDLCDIIYFYFIFYSIIKKIHCNFYIGIFSLQILNFFFLSVSPELRILFFNNVEFKHDVNEINDCYLYFDIYTQKSFIHLINALNALHNPAYQHIDTFFFYDIFIKNNDKFKIFYFPKYNTNINIYDVFIKFHYENSHYPILTSNDNKKEITFWNTSLQQNIYDDYIYVFVNYIKKPIIKDCENYIFVWNLLYNYFII